MNIQRKQKGGSAIVLVIILALFGYVVYVGLQYIPQLIESRTVDSILTSIQSAHQTTPVQDIREIRNSINRQLNVNQMSDMVDKFHVSKDLGIYTIKVSYERELNLGYEMKQIQYMKTLILN